MKTSGILILIMFILSCQKIDYDLSPVQYEINEVFDSGYDIQTEGSNPIDNIIFSSCNSFVYDYLLIKDEKECLAKYVDYGENNIFENWNYVEKSNAIDSSYIHKFIFRQPKVAAEEFSPVQILFIQML